MAKIIINGWREGMEKISLTKLQIEILKLSLSESKKNVDSLLNNEIIVIETENETIAEEFSKKVQKIGVICHVTKDL